MIHHEQNFSNCAYTVCTIQIIGTVRRQLHPTNINFVSHKIISLLIVYSSGFTESEKRYKIFSFVKHQNSLCSVKLKFKIDFSMPVVSDKILIGLSFWRLHNLIKLEPF